MTTSSLKCGKRREADIPSPSPFCPYVGLQPYTEGDREYFFGREREQRVISSNLYAAPLTVLYGASGVGKSSILRAGVVPHLWSAARTAVVYFNQWQDPTFLTRLKLECLEAVERKHGKPLRVDTARALPEFLQAIAQEFKGTLLILLDQFEEYFLYHPESQTEGTFDAEFASAINSTDTETGFVIALRDDWVSRLDRFQARIPNVLGNTVRLEHLDTAAAENAIRKPLDVYNQRFSSEAPPITLEDELVQAVLSQVRAGQLTLSESAGAGQAKARDEGDRIETAFLQLVMTRLWHEEMKTKSCVLRLGSFERLGGARQIVQSHLDDVMNDLPEDERESCARMFRFLVTPKGGKIAHETPDLVAFAERPVELVKPVLEKLSARRVLRRVSPPERYEIFHDVLAPAVLDWRARYVQAQERAEAERRADEQAQVARRFLRLAVAMGLFFLVALAAAIFARTQWRQARRNEKIAFDREGKAIASEGKAIASHNTAVVASVNAEAERKRANERESQTFAALGKAEAERKRAEYQGRLALSDQLAFAALENSGKQAGIIFALEAALVTYSVSKTVLPDVEESLRRAVPGSSIPLIRPGHTSPVTSVTFSPDGTRIATAGSQDAIRIWDASSGEELVNFPKRGGEEICNLEPGIVFSRDGKKLACANEGAVGVWDVDTGRALLYMSGFGGAARRSGRKPDHIEQFAFASDGRFIAIGLHSGTVKVWDTSTSKASSSDAGAAREFSGHWPVFSPDGKRLAATVGRVVKVWDLSSGKELLTFTQTDATAEGTSDSARADLAFSADGTRLATGSGVSAQVWDAASGRNLLTLKPENEKVERVAFSPDGKLMATGGQGSVSIWDTFTAGQLRTLPPQGLSGDTICRLFFSPQGSRLGVILKRPAEPKATQSAIRQGDATAKVGHIVYMWSDVSRNPSLLVPTPTALAFSLDGKQIAVAVGSSVTVEDARSLQPLLKLLPRPEQMTAAAFSPDRRRLATTSSDDTLRMWDATSGRWLRTISDLGAPITSVVFSPDGRLLATAGYRDAPKLWDVASGGLLHVLSQNEIGQPGNPVTGVAFSRDSKVVATAVHHGLVQLWDCASGKEIPLPSLIRQDGFIDSVAFTVDGKRLATGGSAVSIWDAASGAKLDELPGYKDRASSLMFSGDGTRLAVLGERGLQVWEGTSWKEVEGTAGGSVTAGGSPVAAAKPGFTFSSDQGLLAAAGADNTVKLWEPESGKERPPLFGGTAPVAAVAFNGNGTVLYAVDYGWNIYRHRLGVDDLMVEARARLAGHLTSRDCQDYLHVDSCSQWATALGYVADGNALAENGDLDGAVAKFRKAQELNPMLRFDPETQIRRLADSSLMVRLGWLLKQGKLQEAVAAYDEAQRLDPTQQVSVNRWNNLCWRGTLERHAVDVMSACEFAVALDPENWDARDSRGLARALTGNTDGAIEDFQFFIDHTTEDKRKVQRQQWVSALRTGQNPFTPEVVRSLLNQ